MNTVLFENIIQLSLTEHKEKTMKRVLIALLVTSSFTANASYSFLSGGYQFTRVNEGGMGQYFDNRYNNEEASKYLHGFYLRGSWNFYGNFFAEYRTGLTTRVSSTLEQDYLAAGYYIPLADQASVYASMGYASYDATRDINTNCSTKCKNVTISNDGGGFSSELGLRLKPLSWLQIEPSYRYADFGQQEQYEFRVSNTLQFTQHSGLELNAGYRYWKELDESHYQVGYRYSF